MKSLNDLPPGFYSLDCTDVVIDVQGDNTIRPLRPSLRKQAEEEKKKIEKWSNVNVSNESPMKDENIDVDL